MNRAGLRGCGFLALLAHFIHDLDGVSHHLVFGHALKLRIARVLVEDRGQPGSVDGGLLGAHAHGGAKVSG